MFVCILFIIPLGKFGTPYRGKATAAATVALPTQSCWVFSCFRNPPNCDMDCRIFSVRTWSFLCVHIYTQGVGHTDNESTQQFWLEKTSTIFCCAPEGVRTSGLWISNPTLSQLSHPVTPLVWNENEQRSVKNLPKPTITKLHFSLPDSYEVWVGIGVLSETAYKRNVACLWTINNLEGIVQHCPAHSLEID